MLSSHHWKYSQTRTTFSDKGRHWITSFSKACTNWFNLEYFILVHIFNVNKVLHKQAEIWPNLELTNGHAPFASKIAGIVRK